jgi:signal transduction histidine kinase
LLGIDLYANNIDARDSEIHDVLNIITAIAIGSALIVTLIFTRIFLHVRRLTEAKEALEHSYEQLQELDVKKSEFLNIASHELRTPMTSIK